MLFLCANLSSGASRGGQSAATVPVPAATSAASTPAGGGSGGNSQIIGGLDFSSLLNRVNRPTTTSSAVLTPSSPAATAPPEPTPGEEGNRLEGRDNDLRKLTKIEAIDLLVSLGMEREQASALPRWDRIHMIRTLQSRGNPTEPPKAEEEKKNEEKENEDDSKEDRMEE